MAQMPYVTLNFKTNGMENAIKNLGIAYKAVKDCAMEFKLEEKKWCYKKIFWNIYRRQELDEN